MTLAVLLASLVLMAQGPVREEIGVGAQVVMKTRDGVRVGDLAPGGSRAYRIYAVLEAAPGRLRIGSPGVEGWVDAAEVVPRDRAIEHFTAILKDDPRAPGPSRGGARCGSSNPRRLGRAPRRPRRGDPPRPGIRPGLRRPRLRPPEQRRRRPGHRRRLGGDPASTRRRPRPSASGAQARREKGDLDAAIADFTRAIALDSTTPGAFEGRGQVRAAKGDHKGAPSPTSPRPSCSTPRTSTTGSPAPPPTAG